MAALPQYTRGVAKSRVVQLQTAGKSLKEAADLYYYDDKNILLYDVHGAPNNGLRLGRKFLCNLPQATRLTLWLDYSKHPGNMECSGKLTGLCKSLGYK